MPKPHLTFDPVSLNFPTPRFVPTGTIAPTPRTIGGTIETGIAKALHGLGMGERRAAQYATRTMAPLTDATPIGNAIGMEQGGKQFLGGLSKGDARAMALGAGVFALSAMPGPTSKVARRAGKGMFGALLKDTRGTFGGVNAATADLEALARAKSMKNASREDVWNDTGWFKGADGKWRFEIDDSASRYTPDVENVRATSDIYSHPGLFQAYPDLAKTRASQLKMDDHLGGGRTNGYYDTENKHLVVNDVLGRKSGRSTASHELQHVIQEIEGFGLGGSPSQYVQQEDAKLAASALGWRREISQTLEANPGMSWADAEKQVMDDYHGLDIGDWIPPEEARRVASDITNNPDEQIAPLVQLYGLDRFTTPRTPTQMYRSLAGEVEARNVQNRLDWPMEQRRATPPWLSQDLADNDQVIRFK